MTLFEILLVVYLLAVAVWYGGSLTGMLLGLQVRSGGEARSFGRYCMSFAEVAGPLFGAAALLVLGTGIWMVALEGGPQFTDPWVIAVLIGWFVALVLGATAVGMSWMKIGTTLLEPDADLGAARPLIARAVRFSTLDLALRTAIIVLMVWQPS